VQDIHPIRRRYIEAGLITPLPDKLTLDEMRERGFWAAAAARNKNA
jgi:hypothetical protein